MQHTAQIGGEFVDPSLVFRDSCLFFFFFFSSRRRHTRSLRDWSSDVCSSDLVPKIVPREARTALGLKGSVRGSARMTASTPAPSALRSTAPRFPGFSTASRTRSEERRVGKECRSRWSPDDVKKK